MLNRFSHVQLSVTPWTVARKAPLSMGFSRQEYLSGSPCPPPGGLPDPGIKSRYLVSPALAGGFFTTSTAWEASSVGSNLLLVSSSIIFHFRYCVTHLTNFPSLQGQSTLPFSCT